ncbi:MAG: 2-C-methyl-D-erythritol 2,4-cyclodiphosphate synthase [Planctomycetes bacterium]|nr:2-C-methyl-D-erythritol 2,4-cyclodiphosphate synthase [Planctomycetota bacterium]MCB9869808.1 2-C-methyl-D-erythritol 2,4-cyclodiphosphate synthase [Planctomycetota bacterium]
MEHGRRCVLGGIEFACTTGPVGHSDGDAVLHAVCDAVLGAAGLDDLGSQFRDTDPRHAGRDSSEFCREVQHQLAARGASLMSLDIVVEAETPKIGPKRAAMREHIANLFGITTDRVNVRGKTAEGLDAIGRGEAIRATAVALLAV